MAIGYALANSIMIDAPEGLIIVDVTETVESGREIFTEFRKISRKPVKAIIYTHQHPDHTWGAKVCMIHYFDRRHSFHLTHTSMASFLWDKGKQNSHRCDSAVCSVPSGANLFA